MPEASNKAGLLDRIYASRTYRIGALLGVAIALVTAPLALPPVQNAIFKKDVGLTVQILHESPGFDVNRRFSQISVLYRGQDLTAAKKDLLVSQIKILNSGDISISGSTTSPEDPLGVRISGGKLLGLLAATASSNHLRRKAMPIVSEQEVRLPNEIIVDPGDYVQFDVLILKPEGGEIRYIPTGKVEGLKEIKLSNSGSLVTDKPFLYRVFGGDVWVQIVRAISYFIIYVLLIVFFVGFFIQMEQVNFNSKRRRRSNITRKMRPILTGCDPDHWVLISNVYTSTGLAGLRSFQDSLEEFQIQGPPEESAEDGPRPLNRMPAPERREKQSVSLYLHKAFEPRIPLWSVPHYSMDAGKRADIDVDSSAVRGEVVALIKQFERALEEVAVDEGLNALSLEWDADEVVVQRRVVLEAETSAGGASARRRGRTDQAGGGAT